jgi:hypothetical protein
MGRITPLTTETQRHRKSAIQLRVIETAFVACFSLRLRGEKPQSAAPTSSISLTATGQLDATNDRP